MKKETDFMRSITERTAGDWKTTEPTALICRCLALQFLEGNIGVGLLPAEALFSNQECLETLNRLKNRQVRQYDNTDTTQKVMVDGKPFVDQATLESYLEDDIDQDFKEIVSTPITCLKAFFEKFGIKVRPLVDDLTGKYYHAGVFRTISVTEGASVLHCDILGRDGFLKPDFRMPSVLENVDYNQVSFNYLLEDGGYEADSLWAYNKPYSIDHESLVYENGWQFPNSLVESTEFIKYTPSTGSCYGFSTSSYHDVRGGSPLAKRVTFSVFGIWVKQQNTLYLYN